MANVNDERRRNLMRWRLLDYLRDEIDTNQVFDAWVTPLENYRDIADRNTGRLPMELAERFKDIVESDGSYHDPVLREFSDLTKWLLAYYGDLTANMFPSLVDRMDDEKVREKVTESRERLRDSATRLLTVLDAAPVRR